MAVPQSIPVYETTPLERVEYEHQKTIEEEVEILEQLDLPSEDGIPLETNWHRIQMNLLIDSIHSHWRDRKDYFAGGNMFIYFSSEQVRNKSYRGPDFFVVKDVDGTRDRESWVVWKENGRYPDVIVELASPSTIKVDLEQKKHLYELTFHTPEYYCYNPVNARLYGWRFQSDGYVAIQPNERGWLWSQRFATWLGIWEGEFQRIQATWLRLYSENQQLILTMAEAEAQRAEQEAQRAEQEAQRAEQEAQRAEQAEAEVARLRQVLAKHGVSNGHSDSQ